MDQAAGCFVTGLLVVATATALFWLQADSANWLPNTIAVLIVTCPCALALATSNLFVFDKTGTLTAGQPAVAAVIPVGRLNREQCLHYAGALAADSEHPLARALRQAGPKPRLVTEQVENVPACGIRARIAGGEWRLGKPGLPPGQTTGDQRLPGWPVAAGEAGMDAEPAGRGISCRHDGDGINDAPTLAVADVSISFANATDLANSNSDFLILGNDAAALADARRLARRTRRNILQNLAWAAAYNLLAVPFAAAGWIPPWGAAIGMSFSLLVVMNALRLQRR